METVMFRYILKSRLELTGSSGIRSGLKKNGVFTAIICTAYFNHILLTLTHVVRNFQTWLCFHCCLYVHMTAQYAYTYACIHHHARVVKKKKVQP